MLVVPKAFKSVLPVQDCFFDKETRAFTRNRAHQSTSETFSTSM